MTFFQRIRISLALGYILFFFSELVFWSFWRENNSVSEYALTWLFYSVVAYIFLIIVSEFRVRSIWALFLAGAAFGWLGEGVAAMTLFGTETPLPVNISWTGLAWHALISVLIGWYYLGQSLRETKPWRTILISAGLGLFWGFWGMGWKVETPPLITTMPLFFIFAVITTLLFILSHWWFAKLSQIPFTPTKKGKIIAIALPVLFFGAVTVPYMGAIAFILPLLFLGLYLALRKNKVVETEADALSLFNSPVSMRRYLSIFIMPIVATITYGILLPVPFPVDPKLIILIITTALGFIFFFTSFVKVWRQ